MWLYMGNEKHGKKKKTGLGGRNLQNIIFLNIKKDKISFLSLNYYKSLLFVSKLLKVLFSFLDIAKSFDFCPLACFH